MVLQEKIKAFQKLGIFLEQFNVSGNDTRPVMPWLEELNKEFFRPMESLIQNSHIHNPWFTEDNMLYAISTAGKLLSAENLAAWLSCYNIADEEQNSRTIAVIMAGNIPLVGFHDMLCVLISGHNLMAKLSVKDDQMMKLIVEILYAIDNSFMGRIEFAQGRLKDFNAVIATGSNNTGRYFEYYFGNYPNIIRKTRISAAILDGTETTENLKLLADDVFRYFGLGCRSVSKLYVPVGYDFTSLIEAFSSYRHISDHNNWANNYEYQKAIHLIDQIPHLDTGFMLLRETGSMVSPIAVLNYERVKNAGAAIELINANPETIQCIVAGSNVKGNYVPFGKAQEPLLTDYPDNIDTMRFLLNLKADDI